MNVNGKSMPANNTSNENEPVIIEGQAIYLYANCKSDIVAINQI